MISIMIEPPMIRATKPTFPNCRLFTFLSFRKDQASIKIKLIKKSPAKIQCPGVISIF